MIDTESDRGAWAHECMIRDLQRNASEYMNPRRILTSSVARKLADVVRASANFCVGLRGLVYFNRHRCD